MSLLPIRPTDRSRRSPMMPGVRARSSSATARSPSPRSRRCGEEIAAYPVASGPRTLFVVRAGGARVASDPRASAATLDGRGGQRRRGRARSCRLIRPAALAPSAAGT